PTLAALVPEMVGRENLPKAMSISQTASGIGMLIGPALGGLLIGSVGVRLPLLIDAATYLALAVAGVAIQTRRGGRPARAAAQPTSANAAATAGVPQAATTPPSPVPAAAWRLRDDRQLTILAVAFTAVIAAVTAVNVVEIFFVRETLGSTELMYGLVAGAWTVGVLAGAWPFGRVTGADHQLVRTTVLLMGGLSLVVLVSAGVPAAVWLLPIYVVGGVLNAGLNVLSGVVIGRRVPSAFRGRAAGTFAGAANLANVVGYVIGGVLTPLLEPRSIIVGTGVAGLLVAAGFIIVMSRRPVVEVAAEPALAVGYRRQS
ncbi:MAG TPA: MFS transporter, partial [Micromonosporaceae bacterium]